jgi:AcrR family transcriptional regulator
MLKETILAQSAAVVVRGGLAGWNLEEVARGARCAKGLVLYHYRSKAALLDLTAGQIERTRWDRRFGALNGGGGLAGIDRLWDEMVLEVASGRFRAWVSLVAAGYRSTEPSRGEAFRAAMARLLGLPSEALADSTSIEAMIEGMTLLLGGAASREALRAAYDRLWASMVAP